MADMKELPSAEYSLKGMSWQIKVIAEQLTKINQNLEKLTSALGSKTNEEPF